MGGFRDLLALLIGWKSARTGGQPPFRTAAGQVWHTGAATGRTFVTGQKAGRTYTNGQVAGQIHG